MEDALRRQAGLELRMVMNHLHAANIAPMTDDEIQAEVVGAVPCAGPRIAVQAPLIDKRRPAR